MSSVSVTINGQEYNLKGNENEEYLHKVAAYIDEKIHSIMKSNSSLSISSAVVLTALNAADEMFKIKNEYNNVIDKITVVKKNENEMNVKISELEEKVTSLSREKDILQQTAEKYIEESARLKSENKELKFQTQTDKYKIIDLQQKLLENQIDLVKEKKQNKPYINSNSSKINSSKSNKH